MKLFGFGKSREERASQLDAKKAHDAANAEALEMGRNAGNAMTGAVDHFITFRARPVAENVYGVFLEQIASIRSNEEHSPIDLVRIEAKIFVEKLGEYKDRMNVECLDHIREWLDIADQMEVRDTIELYISNKLSDIFMELFERSVNRAAEVIEAYRALGFKAVLTAD
ncbi:hypothetical protein [Phenylobacterium sp.]|uniref:hypothetical protein n=1 Tax=Phenylobacterium sp. TaxID=1871053 RepID=UPI0025E65B67|nr:hypothetical protein [Phenylobacterium sp.]